MNPRLIPDAAGCGKERLLAALRSPGKLRYRRYNGSPLRYAGGKSLAVGDITEQFPDNLERLVSPFSGGASVEIAVAKEWGIPVQGYDTFDILTNYWQVQLAVPEQLAERIAQWEPNKAVYAEVKERLKGHWRGDAPITDRLELAAHYWFNHNLSYGPGFLGWMSRIYQEPERARRLMDKVRTFQCPNLKVDCGSFEETLPQHRQDFLYCDPPYYLDGDSRMFRGIYPQRNFPVHHRNFDHALLRDLLRQHKGGFVLSYNDCSTIREWYADCRIEEVAWQYTLGQGETRIGKNRVERGDQTNVKDSHELLIIKEVDMPRRRAMTSAHASTVKVSGHRNEEDFASLIYGQVNQGSHLDKKDVIDAQHRFHSVKSGTWWQIFLYGRERLETNTILQGLGEVANIMVACLDAYPATYAEYTADKLTAKLNLQPQMRLLRAELENPRVFRAFLEKSLFDGGNADYLSVFLGPANHNPQEKVFHIFHKTDVVDALSRDITLLNSKGRRAGQMDAQKVTFHSTMHGKNIGELEDRHDSPIHYREMKFRLNARDVFAVLDSSLNARSQVTPQLKTYGRAVRMFRLPS